ncbi:hypothetical protein ABZP36_018376 [Zizania latifolia]
MEAKLDRIMEQLKELRQQSGVHQDRLDELSKQAALSAALVDDVKKEQAAARAGAQLESADSGRYLHLAKLKFPTFSGTFPRLWISQCTSYFQFYSMPMELWVPWASMHMEGTPRLWMMTYKKRHDLGWDQFCQAVEQQFGADDYHQKVMALMELRQEGTVSEYRDQFEECMYHVMLFDSVTNEIFYVAMFMNGLHEEIRDAVWMRYPETVTEAARLALMQEKLYNLAMRRGES